MAKDCPIGEADSGLPIVPLPKPQPPQPVLYPDDDVPEDETREQELVRRGLVSPKKS